MAKPLKVLLFSMKGAGEHYGGPGRSAYNLYRYAKANGIVEVSLAHGWPEQKDYELFREQVMIHPAKPYNFRNAISLHRLSLNWIRKNASKYDVYHGLTAYQTPVRVGTEAEKLGLPAVVKIAGYKSDLGPRRGLKMLFGNVKRRRHLVQRLSGVIAISSEIQKELLSYGVPESKIASIPNGVDCLRFAPINSDEKRILVSRLGLQDEPIIAFCGGINQRKRPHLIIEALALLKKKSIHCQAVFAGPFDEPDYLQQMKEKVRDHKLDNCVRWLGNISDTASLLKAADIFCLPSRLEGMPNALLEAMACGLPCISTDISGVNDLIVSHVHGLLIDPFADQLADAIGSYLNSNQLRATHSQAARERVVSRFSSPVIMSAHIQLFQNIMFGRAANDDLPTTFFN